MQKIILFMLMLFSVSLVQANDVPGLTVGTMAPDFTAATYAGSEITLSEYYKDGPVVLIFYRGAWCPYCNVHLKSFEAKVEDFKTFGAKIIAVSVDQAEYVKKTVQEDGLSFDVVSDSQGAILKDYNVIFTVPDELAQKYKNEYKIDLEAHSGRTDHVIAVPATYVIDTNGKIIFASANLDYKVRTQPDEVIDVLNNL